eukprot:23008-Rhodomonas_salina.3
MTVRRGSVSAHARQGVVAVASATWTTVPHGESEPEIATDGKTKMRSHIREVPVGVTGSSMRLRSVKPPRSVTTPYVFTPAHCDPWKLT